MNPVMILSTRDNTLVLSEFCGPVILKLLCTEKFSLESRPSLVRTQKMEENGKTEKNRDLPQP